jgi:predicted metal-dependent peptidase
METKDRIIRAKVHLQKENPFFAYLVMNLNIKEDNKNTDSVGVDNKGNLRYNKKWIDSLTDNQLKGVFSHEVLHLVFEHLIRGRKKEHEVYNIAGDLVINDILINNDFDLPTGLIPYNHSFKINGDFTIEDLDKKNADEVYNELIQQMPQDKKKEMSNEGFDEHIYQEDDKKGNGNPKEEIENQKKWKKIFTEASIYCKQQGTIPLGIERLIDIVLNEKISWKNLLYKYITRELPYDYTYNYPSKKSRTTGIYMPSVLRENINIAVAIDTSGSIGQEELSEFLAEIVNIAKSFNNINMKVIVCDSEIKDVYEVRNGSIETILNLRIRGGGGTDHRPVYDYILENLPNTKFVINFTDGYTSFPEHESVRTIWVLNKNSIEEERIPFGEVIKIE